MLPSSGASGIRLLQAKLSSRTAFVFIGLRQEAGIPLDPGLLPIVENSSPTGALFLSVGSGATTLFPSADYWHHEVIPIGARSGPRNCSHRRSVRTTDLFPPPLYHQQEHSDTPTQLGMSVLPRLETGTRIPGSFQLRWRSPVRRGAAQLVVTPAFPSGSPRSLWAQPRSPRVPRRSPRLHP